MKRGQIFVNGKLFTSDDQNLYADSMIVEDGMIQWAGMKEHMPASQYPQVDLQGRRVLPGFVDGHMHPVMLAELDGQIPCLPPEVHSIEEMIQRIGSARAQQGKEQWILGWGYDEGKLLEQRAPNRYDLDEGCSDAPVCIVRTCLHIRCVNSKALELAGINRNTPDPEGGQIDRDENGEPTGILRESARDLITRIMPQITKEERIGKLIVLGELLASQGITAVCDMGNLEPGDYFSEYMEAARRGFRQKTAIYYMWEHFAEIADFNIPKQYFHKNRQIRAAGLKLIGDGSISGRTAWVNKAYLGGGEYGMSVCSGELLESAIEFCKNHRCQLSVHAMGGRTIDRITERIYKEEKWTYGKTPHLRLEHITEPFCRAIVKAVEAGYGFSVQPVFLYSEIESYLAVLGKERMQQTYPVKDMLESGVKLCFSTDAPATSWAVPSDPFVCIKGAVTRKAHDGTDCGQQQRVSVETAVKLYTKESAEVGGFEKTGQLKAGYAADFIVLDRDLLNVPPEEIDRVKVEETYIAGQRIYLR